MKKNIDIILLCKKCEHLLYIDLNKFLDICINIEEKECPNCGEKGIKNWILIGTENYEEEFGI